MLDLVAEASSAACPSARRSPARPLGLLLGLQTFHPLRDRPVVPRDRPPPLAEQVARAARPRGAGAHPRRDARRRPAHGVHRRSALDRTVPARRPARLRARTRRRRSPRSPSAGASTRGTCYYDLLLADDGHELLLRPLLGYSDVQPRRRSARCCCTRPPCSGSATAAPTCGAICDASIPTFMLTHWVRDRTRGERLPLELVVQQDDERHRGAVRPRRPRRARRRQEGRPQRHRLRRARRCAGPRCATTSRPAAPRLLQRADGYVATIVSGEVITRDGVDTGARPGSLLRGAR